MENERYVAAIEISSSKITGVVGRYTTDGQLIIDAAEKEGVRDCVRYGMIQNLEETATRVSRIIDKLQRRPDISPRKITGLVVGLSGRSLRSIATTVNLSLPEETEITSDIVERLRRDALQTAVDSSLEIVDAVPRIYNIGKAETSSPVGALGSEISVTYDVIVCRPELKRNLQRVIEDKCGLRVEGFVVTSMAAGHLILTGEEKRLGCMLVDMGAETTSVSVYHRGGLRYFATLPLGGRNITRDLTTLSLLEERAEEIKITSGNAISYNPTSSVNINGVKLSDVSEYIVARSEEIVANVLEQISYAGLKEKDLPGGIVCIGGGSRLNGMTELLNRQSGLQVKTGHLPDYIHLQDDNIPASELTEVACVLYEGASLTDVEYLELPVRDELPSTGEIPPADYRYPEERQHEERQPAGDGKVRRLFGKWQNKLSRMFAPPEDDNDSDLFDE
ncbi:MAG: cell division protein FtsA [Muribaculaceae bacterium]|nr:cell division protein FtsA [Muribaculaceae bacterium]